VAPAAIIGPLARRTAVATESPASLAFVTAADAELPFVEAAEVVSADAMVDS
jgi:hypothetical protein